MGGMRREYYRVRGENTAGSPDCLWRPRLLIQGRIGPAAWASGFPCSWDCSICRGTSNCRPQASSALWLRLKSPWGAICLATMGLRLGLTVPPW